MQIRSLALCLNFFNMVRSGYVCEDIKIKKGYAKLHILLL